MAPPVRSVQAVHNKQGLSSSRQKESDLTRSYARSNIRDSYQPSRQPAAPKYSRKSSSLVNVSKTREAFEKKYNIVDSDMEETHLYQEKLKKTKKKSKEQEGKSTMSCDPIDSGFGSSRRNSFTSHTSSGSSFSGETISIDYSCPKQTRTRNPNESKESGSEK